MTTSSLTISTRTAAAAILFAFVVDSDDERAVRSRPSLYSVL